MVNEQCEFTQFTQFTLPFHPVNTFIFLKLLVKSEMGEISEITYKEIR
jgi:hypothetical protein